MTNWEKSQIADRLRANVGEWINSHGEVIFENSRSNEYVGMEIKKIKWQDRIYRIIWVDGEICGLERV